MSYTLISKENYPCKGVPRTVWRIVLPRALSIGELEQQVSEATFAALKDSPAAGAVRVFAYHDEKEVRAVAAGTLSPDGNWDGELAEPSKAERDFVFKFESFGPVDVPR